MDELNGSGTTWNSQVSGADATSSNCFQRFQLSVEWDQFDASDDNVTMKDQTACHEGTFRHDCVAYNCW